MIESEGGQEFRPRLGKGGGGGMVTLVPLVVEEGEMGDGVVV